MKACITMKYLDEFRDPDLARRLIDAIHAEARRCWTIMEVCGGQTHSLLRHGIETELSGAVELIHGPGCPVCVTPVESIDLAHELALQPGITVTSFGDMLRVPGTRGSFIDVRAAGGRVRTVYSPLDAVQLAERTPEQTIVFFGVGFETTAPATALAVLQAQQKQLRNFCVLSSHVRVLPAMEQLMQAADCRVRGFLAAGHVCTVTGYTDYAAFVERFGVPVVVTGFEPVDLLAGIHHCVHQLECGTARIENQYARSVRAAGNAAAQEMVARVYEVADRPWRGLGTIPGGGLSIRPEFAEFDAGRRFARSVSLPVTDASECRSGEVLTGRIKPPECEWFGSRCAPENPLGAPMVSAEGACAAYYQYRPAPAPDTSQRHAPQHDASQTHSGQAAAPSTERSRS